MLFDSFTVTNYLKKYFERNFLQLATISRTPKVWPISNSTVGTTDIFAKYQQCCKF